MADGDTDTLSVLVATDNHLGYLERDPVRGQDSFDAFREILQLAQEHQVDMVLLGGDLFHDNKPSRKCLHQAMTMLRQACLGDAPVALEYLSDPQVDFGPQFPQVNYEDPNLNIGLPVFSIHGNHDDPSGDGNLSAMDMLAVGGLVNYFGRQAEVEHIRVSPVLLRKGKTHLALFGLGNVRDERLHRTIARKRMTMCQPAEATDQWFNLMVLHQNRVAHGPKGYIPEDFLSGFLDLVIWGHEHQCQVDPEYNHQRGFYVSQPGSSVATALSAGESVAKHVALLRINGRKYKMDKIRLKNVRPFVMEDVVLSAVPSLSPQSTEGEIIEYLRQRVEAMIVRAQKKYQEQLDRAHSSVEPALGLQPRPLIRVRVEYSGGFESFHPQRFGLLFADRVANPRDIIYFYRKQRQTSSLASQRTQETQDSRASIPAPVDSVHVESLISEFLDDKSMHMLVDLELAEAVRQFVQKGDNDAIAHSLKSTIDDTQRRILSSDTAVEENSLGSYIADARTRRRADAVAKCHGIVDGLNGENAVAITLAGKKSALKQADRQAIKDFERVAANDKHAGDSDDSDSSDQEGQDDADFRAAGEELNVPAARGRVTKPPASTRARAAPKRGRPTSASEKKESDPSDGEFVDIKPKPRAQQQELQFKVSRPSRNARTTLTSSARSSVLESGSSSDMVVLESPRPTKKQRPDVESPNTIPPTHPSAAAAPGPSRGRAAPPAPGRRVRTRAAQKAGSSQSLAPTPVEIDDSDSDRQEGTGFGRFSLRKR